MGEWLASCFTILLVSRLVSTECSLARLPLFSIKHEQYLSSKYSTYFNYIIPFLPYLSINASDRSFLAIDMVTHCACPILLDAYNKFQNGQCTNFTRKRSAAEPVSTFQWHNKARGRLFPNQVPFHPTCQCPVAFHCRYSFHSIVKFIMPNLSYHAHCRFFCVALPSTR